MGLGAGGLLSYGKPGDRFTVYEIDPVVKRIAENSRHFTFLSNAIERGVNVDIVLGDARLTLEDAEPNAFDLLILDAFSSDSIPIHLVTRDAVAMYLDKLDEGGLLAFHISNRYLNLTPVMSSLAESLGLACTVQMDDNITDRERRIENHYASHWVVMARTPADLAPLKPGQPGSAWMLIIPDPEFRVWTDDFSNILSVFLQ